MSDKFDAAIQAIAVKHGVVLSKDDPILILQTMNNRLIEDTQKAQAAMLVQFREEMENISSQWQDDAKQKAEKVLNSALAGSKKMMARLLYESTNESIPAMKKIISDSLQEARDMSQRIQKFSRLILLSSMTILTGSCVWILLFLIHIFS
ncbi:TPA: conjugal transfer protein TraM [Legionella pneumophila]|nr:conjugal transfer protein TraM [Legionella pneumophila]HEO1403326.1 conjugal transfer protein TraM [Legionella pneumophila]